MRDNWEYIKEAVRDIGGWAQLVLLLIANVSFTFSLATWITKGDPNFTFGWALVLLLLGQQIYAKVTPARGVAYIKTIRLLANQYRARVDDWYTPGTDEHTKASAAAEYLQQNYDVEMILRKSNRNPLARKNMRSAIKEMETIDE